MERVREFGFPKSVSGQQVRSTSSDGSEKLPNQAPPSAGFSQSMKRLIANWPMDEERAKTLLRDYERVFREVGQERFAQAVDVIIREGLYKFFPSQAEFRAYIPKGDRMWKPCQNCTEGFIQVPDFEARNIYADPGATMVRFCECRFQ